jgi:hypothetical protein
MEHHGCEPPRDRVLTDDLPQDWTWPECGDAWQARLLTPPTSPAPRFVFVFPAGVDHTGDAEWVRLGTADG